MRDAEPALALRVEGIKRWQHERFESTYSDLLASERYGRAARFFLADLYGPADFVQRDMQFARVVPALGRLFPGEIIQTVRRLAQLHALSEQLDTQMGREIESAKPDANSYRQAWRTVGRPDARERQIELMIAVGESLDHYTRKALMRQSLRLMRFPANAAGLGALQTFLEKGFDAFREMKGAESFLTAIATRERALARQLFEEATE